MRSKAADDFFFGKTVSSRGEESFWPQIKGLRRKSLGNLANGPIQININSRRGTFATGYTFDIPPGGVPMIKMECRRGHFGIYTMWDESAWVARGGRVDMQNRGQIDFGRMPNVGQQSALSICHLPVFGTGEDLEAQGSILIYLPRIHGDAATAGRAARQFDVP
ncbi:MAG: hypothetical protein EOP84_13470 [Verrucomicrobiaceae bacterium]|nr:MAG: hypothetical protein EOP84_13470 [Verrucomicrobiaceae bacterium]